MTPCAECGQPVEPTRQWIIGGDPPTVLCSRECLLKAYEADAPTVERPEGPEASP